MPLLHRSTGWQRQRFQIETHSAPQGYLPASSRLIPRDIGGYTPQSRCFENGTSDDVNVYLPYMTNRRDYMSERRDVEIYEPPSKNIETYCPRSKDIDTYRPRTTDIDIYTPRTTDFLPMNSTGIPSQDLIPQNANMPPSKSSSGTVIVPPSPTYSLFPAKARSQPPDRPLPALPRRFCPSEWPKRHSSHISSSSPTKAPPQARDLTGIKYDPSSKTSSPSPNTSSPSSCYISFSPAYSPTPSFSPLEPPHSPSPSLSSRSPSPRPDSITLPPLPSPFHAVVTTSSHVQYWISVEDALDRGEKPRGMPEEEWVRLGEVAREVMVVRGGRGERRRRKKGGEWVQLIRGSYEVSSEGY